MCVSIRLLGDFEACLDGQIITGLKSVKVKALLAYLAAEAGRPQSRPYLAGLLWPDYPDRAARQSLRQALSTLRKALTPDYHIEANHQSITLISDNKIQIDLVQLEAAHSLTRCQKSLECIPLATICKLQSALRLYRGPFLESFFIKQCPELENWVLNRREYHDRQFLEVLDFLAKWHESKGELGETEDLIRQQLEIDPWNEGAYQQLMRILVKQGKRMEALVEYERIAKALDNEMGIQPSAEMTSLYEQIRENKYRPEASRTDTPSFSYQMNGTHHKFPLTPTSFVGREKEIEEISRLLDEANLVTIFGAGGVGKTRIALRLARKLEKSFKNGIWFVDLAPLADPELVPQAIAHEVGVQVTNVNILDTLLDYFQVKQILLVLDNCEHLIESCAELLHAILTTCPEVKILATSREAIGILGELIYPLEPLKIPDIRFLSDLDTLRKVDSVCLFSQRAIAIRPNFSVQACNAKDVAQVCIQLEGIPLAIELAAAWVRVLPLAKISQKLTQNIDFLHSSNRSILHRHQTMRACLDWSYDLLSEKEQELLQALSVFAGGWTLEAAEAVCTDNKISQAEALDLLSLLASKSLIQVVHNPEIETRYRLLEPVRQYALEKLNESGKMKDIQDRHLGYFHKLAEQAKPHLRAHQQIEWLCKLERELANIRLALNWANSEDSPIERIVIGLKTATNLHWFWFCRCRQVEGIQWFERIMKREEVHQGAEPRSISAMLARAWALSTMMHIAEGIGIEIERDVYLNESLALFNRAGKDGRHGSAFSKYVQTRIAKNFAEQLALLKDIYTEFEAFGDRLYMAECLQRMGIAAAYLDDLDLAEKYLEKSIPLCQEIGDRDLLPIVWVQTGIAANLKGNPDKARECIAEGRRILEVVQDDLLFSSYWCYRNLGNLAWWMGDYTQTMKDYQTAIDISRNQKVHIICEIRLCCVEMSQGNYGEARKRIRDLFDTRQGKNYECAQAMMLRVYGELEWCTGNVTQAAQWFTELEKVAEANFDATNYHKNSAALGFAKIAISQADWASAAKHIAKALTIQIEKPYYNDGLYEDRYAAVHLAAILSLAQGNLKNSAQMLGSAEKHYRQNRLTFPFFRRQCIDQTISDLRQKLDDETFAAAWEMGKAMCLTEALEFALGMVNDLKRERSTITSAIQANLMLEDTTFTNTTEEIKR